MPFAPEFLDVYELGIKAATSEVDAYAERVDQQHFTDSILERVLNQITKADVLIADMTGKNPNVYYEVGYAHALNKPVLLITQSIDDIPFDLKHRPHTPYRVDAIAKLKDTLRPKITAALNDAGRGRNLIAPCPLELRIDGFTIPEVGDRSPPTILLSNYTDLSHHATGLLTLCNVRSQTRVCVEQIHVLGSPVSSLGLYVGDPETGSKPNWVHNDEEYRQFPHRFALNSSPIDIPYFGVAAQRLSLFMMAAEVIVPMRIELLAHGRRYWFDLLVQPLRS